MFVSQLLGLSISGHKDIDFVDIPTHTDAPLFVNPELIRIGIDVLSKKAMSRIDSYFTKLFDYCSQEDYGGIAKMLAYVGEPNETHLGLSVGRSMGRGASTGILLPILQDMIRRGFFKRGMVNESNDLCLYVSNFSEDRLSDVLINIIRPELCEFTLLQTQNARTSHDKIYMRETSQYNHTTGLWEQVKHTFLRDELRKPILLTPKAWVSKFYTYDSEWFLQHIVLTYRQKVHYDQGSDMCRRSTDRKGKLALRPPTKKDIRRREVRGGRIKSFITKHAIEQPALVGVYRKEKAHHSSLFTVPMRNSELDTVVYRSAEKKKGA